MRNTSPAPDEVRAFRRAHELSAAAAGTLVHVAARTWLRWEAGGAPMPPGLWELAQIKRGQASPAAQDRSGAAIDDADVSP